VKKLLTATLAAATLACLAPSARAGGDGWQTDPAAAKKAASEAGKLVLADFTGSDWCGWCIKLKKEVFDTEAFKAWAKKNVVLLEVDFPRKKKQSAEVKARNRALAKKYGVRGYPTIIFMTPGGAAIGRSGYKRGGPEVWTKNADEILAKGKTFLALRDKEDKTTDEKVELLETELGMGSLTAKEAKARKDAIEGLTAEQEASLTPKLTDLEIQELAKQNPPRSPESAADLGAKFHELFAAGRTPTSKKAIQPYYMCLLEYGLRDKKPEVVDASLAALRKAFGDNPRAKGFFDKQAKRIAEMKASLEGGAKTPAKSGSPAGEKTGEKTGEDAASGSAQR